MNIRESLLTEHSKEMAMKVCDYILAQPTKMPQLMDCFYDDNWRLNQVASWPLRFIATKNPEIIKPYLEGMIRFLEMPRHDAVIRNTMAIFQFVEIPDELMGEVYERAFEYLMDIKRPTAIRAFSVTVLGNITDYYPDLILELIAELELQGEHGTAGFKNRVKRTLMYLRKKNNK